MNKEEKASLIILLREIISEESEKGVGEEDAVLMERCEELLAVLLGDSCTVSDDELKERIKLIKSGTSKASKKIGIRRRLIQIIAAIVSSILIMGIGVSAACIIEPKILEGMKSAFNIGEGESIDLNGVTLVNNGTTKTYSTLKELSEKNSLNILCFESMPEGLFVESVVSHGKDLFPLQIIFNDTSIIYCVIKSDHELNTEESDGREILKQNDRTYVINKKDNGYFAAFFDNGYIYQITNDDKDKIIEIFEYLK